MLEVIRIQLGHYRLQVHRVRDNLIVIGCILKRITWEITVQEEIIHTTRMSSSL